MTPAERAERIREAESIDEINTRIAGVDDLCILQVADELRAYAILRLERADERRPFSRMEREYCDDFQTRHIVRIMDSPLPWTGAEMDMHLTNMWARAFEAAAEFQR